MQRAPSVQLITSTLIARIGPLPLSTKHELLRGFEIRFAMQYPTWQLVSS